MEATIPANVGRQLTRTQISTFLSEVLGTSINLAFYVFAIWDSGSMLARFTATLLADRFGALEILTVANVITAIVTLCWPAVDFAREMIAWVALCCYCSIITPVVLSRSRPKPESGPRRRQN